MARRKAANDIKAVAARVNLLVEVQDYIDENNLRQTVEEIFVGFERAIYLHREFNDHLEALGLTRKLKSMKRVKKITEKRRLFGLWYVQKTQNEQQIMSQLSNLEELLFVSERTILRDILTDTTRREGRNAT